LGGLIDLRGSSLGNSSEPRVSIKAYLTKAFLTKAFLTKAFLSID
jgi:hypothetical protein